MNPYQPDQTMPLAKPSKPRYLGLAIILLVMAASPVVIADQYAEDELAGVEPPLTCLGLEPCDLPRDSATSQGNGKHKRYRGSKDETDVRPKGSAEAERVLEQVYALPEADKRFFYDKLSVARGFAIFPDVRKSGLMAATVYGNGIMSFRDQTWEWKPPILLHLHGKSFGPHITAQRSTIIFVFDRICDIRDFLQGHHNLVTTGATASIAHVGHAKPAELGGIKIYTVSNGITMGQSLESYSVHIDEEGNTALYGMDIKPHCILDMARVGPQLPWFMKFMRNMQLPPGQPHSTTTVK
jgi:lipid-binding SYLF domain-containing protein